MAYLKARGKKWYACYKRGGKLIVEATEFPVKDEKTKKLAQDFADTQEAVAKGIISVDDAIESIRLNAEKAGVGTRMPTVKEYLDAHVPRSDGESAKKNFARARKLFYASIGQAATKKLNALPATICERFVKEQLQQVRFATVESYVSYIQSAFNKAKREGLIRTSPFDNISVSQLDKSGKPRKVKILPFNQDDMNIILTKFPYPYRELAAISFLTGGQRVGDCCLLRWEHIDFERNLISFSTSKTDWEMNTPMVPYLRNLLLELKGRYDADDEFVLPSLAHTYQASQGYVSTQFSALLRAFSINVPVVAAPKGTRCKNVSQRRFHSVRHSVVSYMRESTLFTADTTRDFVGHASEAIERGYFTGADSTKLLAQRFLLEQSGIIIDEEKAPTEETP